MHFGKGYDLVVQGKRDCLNHSVMGENPRQQMRYALTVICPTVLFYSLDHLQLL